MKDVTLKELQLMLLKQIQTDLSLKRSVRKNYNPKVWGPPAWKFLDKIAQGHPVKPTMRDKMEMLDFLQSLGHVLPCARCRENHIAFSQKLPPMSAVASKRKVKAWLDRLKAKTNKG